VIRPDQRQLLTAMHILRHGRARSPSWIERHVGDRHVVAAVERV
jgi:hypothetical protein